MEGVTSQSTHTNTTLKVTDFTLWHSPDITIQNLASLGWYTLYTHTPYMLVPFREHFLSFRFDAHQKPRDVINAYCKTPINHKVEKVNFQRALKSNRRRTGLQKLSNGGASSTKIYIVKSKGARFGKEVTFTIPEQTYKTMEGNTRCYFAILTNKRTSTKCE